MRIVVALGGNALQRRGEPMTVEGQRANVATACQALAPVAARARAGDHPRQRPPGGHAGAAGGLVRRGLASYPFDVLGAQTEGMIGYFIEQELGNLLPFDKPLATILTMTEVDPADPAFTDPTKFVGPVYTEADAQRLAARKGWTVTPGRRAVASGRPLADAGADLRVPPGGVAARVRAAWSSAPAAVASRPCTRRAPRRSSASRPSSTRTGHRGARRRPVGADLLVIATDVDAVYLDWGTPAQSAVSAGAPGRLVGRPVPRRVDGTQGGGGGQLRPQRPASLRSSGRSPGCRE